MSDPKPDPKLAGAGLSATGKTADQFSPGDDAPGTTYGGPTGTDGGAEESTASEPEQESGEDEVEDR